jgi:hypothetical protein
MRREECTGWRIKGKEKRERKMEWRRLREVWRNARIIEIGRKKVQCGRGWGRGFKF